MEFRDDDAVPAAAVPSGTPPPPATPAATPPPRVSLGTATRTWALVGLNSFGGPAGQIAVMHRFLVEERRWISERRFLHALNYCMVLPGPEAQQLAVYVGWLLNGVLGGVIAGVLFVLPGFLAMLGLSILYATVGDVNVVGGLLFGLQAAVVVIVVEAVLRIGRRALSNRTMLLVAAAAFAAIFFYHVQFPLIVGAAALLGYLSSRLRPGLFTGGRAIAAHDATADHVAVLHDGITDTDPRRNHTALRAAAVCAVIWLVPVALLVTLVGTASVFTQESLLFSKSAVVTFGGAYAVLAYITQQAVNAYGWLRPSEMLTGLGLAETTPGPLIMVVQFVGFLAAYRNPGPFDPLVAGVLGSLITVWVTFVPCFLFIFLGAPVIERLRGNRALSSALAAITAAVVGVVLNLALWFALHTSFDVVDERAVLGADLLVPDWASLDLRSLGVSIVAALLIFRLRWGVLRTLGVCAALGAVIALSVGV